TRAGDERNPLVQRGRLHLQDPLATRRCRAPGLLDHPGDGISLVDQPQTSVAELAPFVAGVEVDAAAREDAIDVGDRRTGPTHVEVATARTILAAPAILNVGTDRVVPMARIGIVDGIFVGALRNLDLRLREQECRRAAVEREDLRAGADRDD